MNGNIVIIAIGIVGRITRRRRRSTNQFTATGAITITIRISVITNALVNPAVGIIAVIIIGNITCGQCTGDGGFKFIPISVAIGIAIVSKARLNGNDTVVIRLLYRARTYNPYPVSVAIKGSFRNTDCYRMRYLAPA